MVANPRVDDARERREVLRDLNRLPREHVIRLPALHHAPHVPVRENRTADARLGLLVAEAGQVAERLDDVLHALVVVEDDGAYVPPRLKRFEVVDLPRGPVNEGVLHQHVRHDVAEEVAGRGHERLHGVRAVRQELDLGIRESVMQQDGAGHAVRAVLVDDDGLDLGQRFEGEHVGILHQNGIVDVAALLVVAGAHGVRGTDKAAPWVDVLPVADAGRLRLRGRWLSWLAVREGHDAAWAAFLARVFLTFGASVDRTHRESTVCLVPLYSLCFETVPLT